jgi:hypothetical protein
MFVGISRVVDLGLGRTWGALLPTVRLFLISLLLTPRAIVPSESESLIIDALDQVV